MFPMIGMMKMTRMLTQMEKMTRTTTSSKKSAQVAVIKHFTMRFDPCALQKSRTWLTSGIMLLSPLQCKSGDNFSLEQNVRAIETCRFVSSGSSV